MAQNRPWRLNRKQCRAQEQGPPLKYMLRLLFALYVPLLCSSSQRPGFLDWHLRAKYVGGLEVVSNLRRENVTLIAASRGVAQGGIVPDLTVNQAESSGSKSRCDECCWAKSLPHSIPGYRVSSKAVRGRVKAGSFAVSHRQTYCLLQQCWMNRHSRQSRIGSGCPEEFKKYQYASS